MARSRGAATPSSRASRGPSRGGRRHTRRGHGLPPVPRGRSGDRGGHGDALDRAGAPRSTNRYSVIYARQGGRWLQARIRDEPSEEVSPHERLLRTRMDARRVGQRERRRGRQDPCKWSDNGNFLLREFNLKVEGRIALSGTQRIGWDSQREQFRMWVFDDRGGFAEGLLSRDGERWVVQGVGSPVGRRVGLVHERDHAPRQGPDSLGDPGADGRRRSRAWHRPVLPGPSAARPGK